MIHSENISLRVITVKMETEAFGIMKSEGEQVNERSRVGKRSPRRSLRGGMKARE